MTYKEIMGTSKNCFFHYSKNEKKRFLHAFVPTRKHPNKIFRSFLIKILEKDGWYLERTKGSHRQYKHSTKKGVVTIAHHGLTKTIAPGMLKSILKQAQIEL